MTYTITRRCLDRRYFLKATPRLVQRLKYVVGEACRRYGVELHCVVIMFNHVHLGVTDRLGLLPPFMQDVFRQITRVKQAERPDIDGPVFDNRPPCVTALLTPKAVAKQLAYVVTNPVTANLVPQHDMWPGLISAASQLDGYEEEVARPEGMLRGRPEQTCFRITPWQPAKASASAEERVRLQQEVLSVAKRLICEREAASAAARRGRGTLGVQRLMEMDHHARPEGRSRRSDVVPALAASDRRVLDQAKRVLRDWRCAYREARRALEAKREALFPTGSWWLPWRGLAQATALAGCPIAYCLGFG